MDVMERLFEVYASQYDALAQDVRRLAAERGSPDPAKLWAQRMTRGQFVAYLSDASRVSEAKRLFLQRLVDGHEELLPLLPDSLLTMLDDAPVPRPHFLQTQRVLARR